MLIEIMVVVAIIGLVMGGVALVAWRAYQRAQIREAQHEVHTLMHAIVDWRLDHNERLCPATLDELYQEKRITKLPRDPWGQPFVYVCPAQNDDGYDISSKGPDRLAGTDDDIRDSAENGKEGRGTASQ